MMNPVLRLFFLAMMCMTVAVMRSSSQSLLRVNITGTVVDDSSNVPLENVNVFISQTTLGAGTDLHGCFEIKNVPQGSYSITASRIGYEVSKVQIVVTEDGISQFEIRLKLASIHLGEVVVSAPDPSEWRKQLVKFQICFFGQTENGESCRILNPEVLDFSDDEDLFTARADAPLEIENEALGYHIRFLMTVFRVGTAWEHGLKGKKIEYDGSTLFSQLEPSAPEKLEKWKMNRIRAYEGSVRHFIASLTKGSWETDGYRISLEDKAFNPGIQVGRLKLTAKNIDLILSPTASPDFKTLHYDGVLEVKYYNARIERVMGLLVKAGGVPQVSWLQLNLDSITVNSLGRVEEHFPTTVFGYWEQERFASNLPLDYELGD
jgi:hypothetical protein